jgi:hypothetical protein
MILVIGEKRGGVLFSAWTNGGRKEGLKACKEPRLYWMFI